MDDFPWLSVYSVMLCVAGSFGMHSPAKLRWCPGYSLYDIAVIRTGNCIGEQLPKPCDSSYKPPRESFINREIPVFVPLTVSPQVNNYRLSDTQVAAGYKPPRPALRGNTLVFFPKSSGDPPRTAGLRLSRLREMNMF